MKIGLDPSAQDFFSRTAVFGLRFCLDASVDEFVDVLREFKDAGANIDHVDMFGNNLLLMTEVDNLGVALVEVGARISYDWQNYNKRGLANAAIYGCPRTIDAMVLSRVKQKNPFGQEDFDSCFDQAAKTVAYNPVFADMTGIVKLVDDYGANPNRWSTLHYGVRLNHVLVSYAGVPGCEDGYSGLGLFSEGVQRALASHSRHDDGRGSGGGSQSIHRF